MIRQIILFFTLLFFSVGCISSNAVKRVNFSYQPRQLASNVLTTGDLSAGTKTYLALYGFDNDKLENSNSALIKLRNQLSAQPERIGVVAFSELAFRSAEDAEDDKVRSKLLLTAARAAYAVVFDKSLGPPLESLDPNLRFAADLYNFSLSQLVDLLINGDYENSETRELDMVGGHVTLSRGSGTGVVGSFKETLVAFFHATDEFEIENRRRGIGVPLVAVRPPSVLVESGELLHPPVEQSAVTPLTMLLRFKEPWNACGEELNAVTELWNPFNTAHVDIEGQRVSLEADSSLALAMMYDRNSEYRGLLKMPGLLRSESTAVGRGLFLLEPYNAKKIPVVLCHGLMDSPLTWVPMLNALLADPVIRDRYQFWLFFYPTMNPVLQSASELRQSLLSFHSKLQREKRAWSDMVIVGHSMGGMVSRLQITSSGPNFGDVKADLIASAGNDSGFLSYIKTLVDFEPLPFVKRAVFIATPHRGAVMADGSMGMAGKGIIRRPEYIRSFIEQEEGREKRMESLGNSIVNLSPESLLSNALGISRWETDVPVHSIIGDRKKAGALNGSDGIVDYWSSHVDGAASEIVVKAGHLYVHKQIPAIAEVRRILLKHLKQ